MAQLKDEFGCSSIEEARRMLRKLEQQTKTAKMQFDKTFEAFMEEWGDALVGNS